MDEQTLRELLRRMASREACEAEKRKRAAEEAILLALQDAEAAYLPDCRVLTYYERNRKSYVVPTCVFRVLQIVKGDRNA